MTAADLMRVSDFQRLHTDGAQPGMTRLASLSPSLMHDLMRFESRQPQGLGLDLLEVLAGALRHGCALLLHLQMDYRVIPVTVLPHSRQVQGPLALAQWLALRLPDLRVLSVEPARAAAAAAGPVHRALPPGLPAVPQHGPQPGLLALDPLLWQLALRGARAQLLPEIAGVARYRVNPSADLQALGLDDPTAAAVARLRQHTTPLQDMAGWPGFDRERASRLLNGLYLQSALMVTRSHPLSLDGGG